MENNYEIKFKGDQFVFVPENKSFVCITTKQNLRCMVDSSDFFADGRYFYCIIIMHQCITSSFIQLIVYKMDFIYPWLIFSCLKNPNKPTLICGYFFRN